MARGRSSASGKRPSNTFGLNPYAHPKTVRAFVDQDYVAQLTPAEREWLARFNDSYYGADYRDDPFNTPTATRRLDYRRKNAANRDIWGRGYSVGPETPELDADDSDLSEPPAYLATARYKLALLAYRAVCDRIRANKISKRMANVYLASARLQLERAKHGG